MRRATRRWATGALVGAIATAAGATGSHLAPSARLEHERIGLEQATVLVIEVESSGLRSVDFEPDFKLENLEVLGRPSRASAMNSRNGRMTRRDSLIWTLRPVAVGPAYVKAIRVTIDESVFVLDDLSLAVQEEPVELERPPSRRSPFDDLEDLFDPFGRRRVRDPRPAPDPKVFLRAEITPREPYVGQQVLYTLYLFTQADVAAIDPEELPNFEGVWVHELPQPERQGTEMTEVGDERYGRAVLLRKALFPLRPGRLEFSPVSARLAIKVPERSVFGPLLDRTREIRRTSNKVAIDVKPLPPAPPDYAGAVGQLELAVDLEPAELEVGEAATLSITLRGAGHIQGLEAPELEVGEGLRRFPPEQSGGNRVHGTKVTGERSWTYVMVPDTAGSWQLGPIQYPYFDPAAGEYRVASTEPKTLQARPETVATVAEQTAPEREVQEAEPVPRRKQWPGKPWLFGLAALVPLLLVVALRGVRTSGPRRRRVRDLKQRLRRAVAERRPRAAAEAVETAWREHLTERWRIDADSSPESWGDQIEDRGAAPEAAEQMDRLAEDLRYLRFAPELSSTAAVRDDLLQRSLRLVRLLG